MKETKAPATAWSVGIDLMVLCLLTVLVWGLFALDRGLWRDDVFTLSAAQKHFLRWDGWGELLTPPRNTPTRCLLVAAYAASFWTGDPRVALQLLYGLVWLAIGFGSYWIAREIFASRRVAYLAGALTICATGDFYSISVGSLTYNIGTLMCVLAFGCTLAWQRTGRVLWLPASGIALSLSIWHIDGAMTSVVLAPLLFWAAERFRFSRRLLVAVAWWIAISLPYFVVFSSSLVDPASYAATGGMVFKGVGHWLERTAVLFGHNFMPWRWVFDRPVFEWVPPVVIPWTLSLGLAALGTLFFIGGLRRKAAADDGERVDPPSWWWSVIGLLMLLALAANAMYAMANLSHLVYRTQLVSRVWTSIALAMIAARLSDVPLPRFARASTVRLPLGQVAASAFIFLGILGGLERQDYYLASWLQHRQELASIVASAPRLTWNTKLILRVPLQAKGVATANTRLGRAWASLLYQRLAFRNDVFAISRRGGGCRGELEGLRCWSERERNCFDAGKCPGRLIRYDEALVMSYLPRENRYRIETQLPLDLQPDGEADVAYHPEALIRDGPVNRQAKSLLGGGRFLARFLPGLKGKPSDSMED